MLIKQLKFIMIFNRIYLKYKLGGNIMKKQMKKVLCVVLSILMAFSYAVPAFAGSIDNTHLSTKQSDVKSDAEVKAVEKEIDNIGRVKYTEKSYAKITVAENAYNVLSDYQKAEVSNYGILKAAKDAYEAAKADNIDTSSYTITDKGSLSDDVNWFVYDNGLLEITGKGSISSYSKGNAPWYQYKDTITSILVRSSITDIGDSSFYGCNNVTEITLPFVGASRDAIGYSCSFGYIFGYSTSSYTSSNSFDDDFAPDYGYKGPFYNGVYDNGYYYYRFSVPSSLKKVTVTDATQIGKGAFHKCTGISEIVLNDGITSIGDYAFYNCGVKDFAIPNTVETIGKYAFYNCNNLQEVFISNSVTAIGAYTFYGCNGITKLNISENVTTIGNYAFYGCSSLTELNIPNKTESVGSYAFAECRNLKKINIPDSVTNLGEGAFSSETSMSASDLIIGSGLNAIPQKAFKNCKALTTINVPKTVTSIGDSAFYGCDSVTEITLPFVGASRDAKGYSCSFGYIFGYSTSSYTSSNSFDDDFAPDYGYKGPFYNGVYDNGYYYYRFSVPSSLKKVTVTDATQIGKGAFHKCTGISEIVLNDGITSIGDYAFYNCGVKDFAIPNTVETIGKYAFYGCSSLQDMFIPNSVKSIEPYTFYNCNGINKLAISENVTSIGDYAFYGCSGIDNLIIPNQTESIGYYAFSNCKGLKKINIPDSVTTMGKGAFSSDNNSMNISELHIGSGLKAIPEETFKNCNQLTSVIVPNTVERIGSRAFSGCNKLTEITLPFVGASRDATGYSCSFGYIFDYSTSSYKERSYFDGDFAPGYGYETGDFTTMGNGYYYYYYDFSVPSSLKTVTITDADQIGKGAFHQCTNISKIVLNDGITSIGDYAFYNNPWYNNLTDEFVTVGDNVLIKYNGTKSSVTIPDTVKHIAGGVFKNNNKISEVILPNGLLSIGDNAFKGTALSTVTIPRSVTKIGTNAFSSCNLKVYQPSAGYDYDSSNKTVLNDSYTKGNDTFYYIIKSDDTAEIIGCETTSTELTVPEEIDGHAVSSIGDYGFAKCSTLKSITIPKNIKTIGKYAFDGCTGLINATIPTTVSSVDDYAFNNCTGLKNVTISEGVVSIGKGCFYNCTSLAEAVVPDTAKYVGAYAFYNCTSMVNATIGTTTESIGECTFYNCEKLETVVIGYSVKSIGNYAFYNCALGRVSVPSATTVIGNFAFAENSNLTKATLRKNLLTIGDGAFKDCGLLSTISIPTTVTSIGDEAFENCTSIASVTIPTGVTEIKKRTFSNCSSLANVTIKGEVTSIGESAFLNNAFTAIQLPESLKTIGSSAFKNCGKLEKITLPNNTANIGNAAFLNCSALHLVSVPDSVAFVGKNVFFYNDDIIVEIRKNSGTVADKLLTQQGIHHVILDENISTIGKNVFDSCYELSTVTYGNETVKSGEYKLSKSIKTICSEAFKDNPLLRNLIVPDTLGTIGDNAFYNAIQSGHHCKDVTVTFYYVNGEIAANILNSQYVSHIVVNDNIHALGEKAFFNMPVLESISLPDTISSVGANVFANPGKKVMATFRGVDGTIDASVYDGKISGICYLYIEDGIKKIGKNAFANSDTVLGVEIVNTDTIDDYAFSNCPAIKQLYIDSVVNINDYAFYNDIAIDDIVINQDLVNIGSHAFDSCKLISKVKLPNTVRNIGAYAFYDCNSMKSINIPVGVDIINEYTFFGCASLLSVDLPNTVKSIGDYAYYGCVLVNDLSLGNAVESIGAYAFYNCNKVKEILLPDSLKSIGNYAFRSCSTITEITIPDSVTQLGDCVFYACTGLERAEFGTGIVKIGNSEFYGCVKFTELYLYGNVNNIHDLAFYGAEDAEVYTYPNSYVEDYCNDNGLVYHEIGNITSVSLTPPSKTEYVENDKLDTAGMKFNVTYDNGYERTVTSGLKITGFDSENVGKQTVTVSYRGKSATFEVNVSEKKVVDAEFEFPNDIKIIQGEDLDLSSGKVILTYSDGSQQTIKKGYAVTGFDKTKVGKQNITITYRDFSTDLEVAVEEKQEPEHTHNWSDWKYNNDAVYNSSSDYKDGTQTRTCSACGESETKEAPNTALLRRRGNALSLESSITLATYITKDVVDYYDEVYAEFTRNGKTEKVYPSGKTLTSNSIVYCIFDYTGISPQALGDDVSITFYGVKDGVTYNGNAYKYSATDYIKSTLNKPTSSAKLKTLLVDLVYYGEACQVYQNYKTDNLLTDILTDEQKALRSTADLNVTNIKNASYETCENRLVKFGTALRLNNSVEIAIPLNMTNVTLDDLSFKVKIGSRTLTYTYAENPDNFEKGKDGYWYFYFDGVYANQMSDEVFITAYKGDEQVSYTLKYSVESYAATVTDAKLKAVTDAMMRYGNSAKAYAGK